MNIVKYIATNKKTGIETPLDPEQYERFIYGRYKDRFTFRVVKEPDEVTALKQSASTPAQNESAEESK